MHRVDADLHQTVGVETVRGSGVYPDTGKVHPHHPGDLYRPVGVVDRDDEDSGATGSRRLEDMQAVGVAEIRAIAEVAGDLDPAVVGIQRAELDSQQAMKQATALPDTPEAGNHQ